MLTGGSAVILTAMSHLEPIIAPAVEAAGFRLVRLRLMGGKRKTLQVMAEREDGSDECRGLRRRSAARCRISSNAKIRSKAIIELEVSSPGIDRPLTRLDGFRPLVRPRGQDRTGARRIDGRKRFRATLLGLDGNDVVVGRGRRDVSNFPSAPSRKPSWC